MDVKLVHKHVEEHDEDYFQEYDSVTFIPNENNEYVIDIQSLHKDITRMIIENHKEVAHVSLTVGTAVICLFRTTPNDYGEVVFWENWCWKKNYNVDAKIVITMRTQSVPIVEFKLRTDIVWLPIFIPEQKWVPKQLEGTPHNNVLLCSDGSVALRYVH